MLNKANFKSKLNIRIILVTATALMTYFYNIFFIVGHDNLDYTLIHPVSSFWFSALNRIDLPNVFNSVINIIALVVLFGQRKFSLRGLLLFIIALILGMFFIFLTNQLFLT